MTEDRPGNIDGNEWVPREWQGVGGLTLRARDWLPADPNSGGSRVPVLCLAGLSRNARDFDRLARFLKSQGYRAVAMDYRGRGASDRDPNADYTLATESEDIALGLDALGIGEFAVVGTSRGGIHAMLLATRMAERMRAVVLNDIGPKVEYEGLARIANLIGTRMEEPTWRAKRRNG